MAPTVSKFGAIKSKARDVYNVAKRALDKAHQPQKSTFSVVSGRQESTQTAPVDMSTRSPCLPTLQSDIANADWATILDAINLHEDQTAREQTTGLGEEPTRLLMALEAAGPTRSMLPDRAGKVATPLLREAWWSSSCLSVSNADTSSCKHTSRVSSRRSSRFVEDLEGAQQYTG